MNEPIVFQLYCPIPSKKNNRVVLKNGINIPSKEYRNWHKIQLLQIKPIIAEHGRFSCPVSVNLGISFKDRHRRDLDNSLTSVLDLLKDSGIIDDDDWLHVPKISSEVVDTRENYAIVTISPSNLSYIRK